MGPHRTFLQCEERLRVITQDGDQMSDMYQLTTVDFFLITVPVPGYRTIIYSYGTVHYFENGTDVRT